MGDWFGTYHVQAIAALKDESVPDWLAAKLAKKLADAGVLVSAAYYVPSPDELYGLMRAWQYRNRTEGRWVMCRETHDALARIHAGKRVPPPFEVRPFVVEDPSRPYDEPDPPVVAVQTRPARLFDIEVRIDPAARSPLFEIDSEATKQRAELGLINEERWKP